VQIKLGKAKMTEFKYLGQKLEDYVGKFVELPLHYDAKFELNQLMEDIFKKHKETIKKQLNKEFSNESS
jgi:hypothetical protein